RGLGGKGLGLDLAVAYDKRVGPERIDVVDRLGRPDDVSNVPLDRPLLQFYPRTGLGELGKKTLEQWRDIVRAAQHARRRAHDRVLRVVRHDARQVAGAETLQVVVEHSL